MSQERAESIPFFPIHLKYQFTKVSILFAFLGEHFESLLSVHLPHQRPR